MKEFNIQPSLSGETVSVRPMEPQDYSGLYAVANDKLLWAGHPSKNRYEESEFKKWFDASLASNNALVILDTSSQRIIGSTRFYEVESLPKDISIGYTFISREYWGGDTNFDVKSLMLDYAFNWFDTVWFHISPDNIRSRKATAKIGAELSHEEYLNLGGATELWCCYKLEKSRWKLKLNRSY